MIFALSEEFRIRFQLDAFGANSFHVGPGLVKVGKLLEDLKKRIEKCKKTFDKIIGFSAKIQLEELGGFSSQMRI